MAKNTKSAFGLAGKLPTIGLHSATQIETKKFQLGSFRFWIEKKQTAM